MIGNSLPLGDGMKLDGQPKIQRTSLNKDLHFLFSHRFLECNSEEQSRREEIFGIHAR
jgi:hypothetical protein